MPVFTPDFSEAIDMGPITPGTYPAKVMAFTAKQSKAGNAMLEGDVEVMVEGKPRSRKIYLLVSGKGSGGLKEYFRAIGRDDLANGGVPFDSDEIVGVDFMAVVEQQEYQGQTRDQITRYLKA